MYILSYQRCFNSSVADVLKNSLHWKRINYIWPCLSYKNGVWSWEIFAGWRQIGHFFRLCCLWSGLISIGLRPIRRQRDKRTGKLPTFKTTQRKRDTTWIIKVVLSNLVFVIVLIENITHILSEQILIYKLFQKIDHHSLSTIVFSLFLSAQSRTISIESFKTR